MKNNDTNPDKKHASDNINKPDVKVTKTGFELPADWKGAELPVVVAREEPGGFMEQSREESATLEFFEELAQMPDGRDLYRKLLASGEIDPLQVTYFERFHPELFCKLTGLPEGGPSSESEPPAA